MSDTPTIEAEAETVQAVALREPNQVSVSPLDMDPHQFAAGLDRRKTNRETLMAWIRDSLKDGVDFGSVSTKRGKSKPSLRKPGAEKICGMLGVTVTFPNLSEYEQAVLKGIVIRQVILRCELMAGGNKVAEGAGARSVDQDDGDLNKCLKMAEKSAHIDATLRMAGISEVFTQDIEDMPPGRSELSQTGKEPSQTAKTAPRPTQAPARATPKDSKAADFHAKVLRSSSPTVGTPDDFIAASDYGKRCLAKFLTALGKLHANAPLAATGIAQESGWLLPTEFITDLAPKFAPLNKGEFDQWMESVSTKLGIKTASAESPKHRDKEEWREFLMPFGKNKGTPLEDLPKNHLFGWWANYEVETEYNGKPKKPETIAKDKVFRKMLDAAGKEYEFKKVQAALLP